jgi:hypothetical protein
MATLVSPGVSVTITNESFYIPVTAPTVPLFFIATQADKLQPDGVSPAAGTQEYGIVRTVTSLGTSTELFGVPAFKIASGDESLPIAQQRQLHGDARNEYGLFALNQFLGAGNRAYTVRADVDLTDAPTTVYTDQTPNFTGVGDGDILDLETVPATGVSVNQSTAEAEIWTITATNATTFSVSGSVSGSQAPATVNVNYNNGIISFKIPTPTTAYIAGDVFTVQITAAAGPGPLGSSDSARRANIVAAIAAQINSNTEVRSEIYEYNIILAPGYHEVVDELQALSVAISEEAFVIGDTQFTDTPAQAATWGGTNAFRPATNTAYYYPHGIASNLDGANVFIASSGIALRTIATSDNASEIWFAPAGANRGNVTGVDDIGYITGTLGTPTTFKPVKLNPGQRDALYEKSINPIAFFPGRGILVFGQKTSTTTASALDRINVSRLMMYIKRGLRKGAFPYIFEPNDSITRGNLKSMVDGFLGDIMIKRGLYDFATLCNEVNNTPTRIDRNELWCDAALKPVKTAEFVYIPVRVVSTGANI